MHDSPEQPSIRLDQFLQAHGLVDTGGQAKLLIQEGQVTVNGQTETRRRRQLREGDRVQIAEADIRVQFESGSEGPEDGAANS